jgi:antitoxin component YwqK of YwqJK toxin-antitoxin module
MKYFLLPFVLVAFSTSSFSQSKKEQIEILNARVDSIKQILSSERNTSAEKSSKISELNTKITDLDGKILNLEKEKANLNNTISQLNSKENRINDFLNQMKIELGDTKTNLENTLNSKNQEIAILNLQIKTKSDSLKLVQNELNKLKPTPKQSNTNQNTNSVKRVELKDITQIQDGNLYYYVLKTPLETTGNKEKVNGIVFSNYSDGKIFEENTFKEGNLCGPFKVYFHDGKIKEEGSFSLDGFNYEGIRKKYHVNGRLKRKTDYRNGTAWEDRCYDENGDEIKPCPKDY